MSTSPDDCVRMDVPINLSRGRDQKLETLKSTDVDLVKPCQRDHAPPASGAGSAVIETASSRGSVGCWNQGADSDSNSSCRRRPSRRISLSGIISNCKSWFKEEANLDEEALWRAENDVENLRTQNALLTDQLEKLQGEIRSNQEEWAAHHKSIKVRMGTDHRKDIQNLVTKHETEIATWKKNAEHYQKLLGDVEEMTSKDSFSTGSHKDSAAIPPNLEKAVLVLKEAAFSFRRTFVKQLNFSLAECYSLQHFPPLQSNSRSEIDRYRKYILQADICRHLFAGFENDRYNSGYEKIRWQANEEADFFLKCQDSEARAERYLSEYNTGSNLMPIENVIQSLRTNTFPVPSFQMLWWRKLHDMSHLNFRSGLPVGQLVFHCRNDVSQLAIHPDHGEFFKSFLNLVYHAWLLHRLAFSFKNPARIFRCAEGIPFDETYMDSAIPIDDDINPRDLIVGVMVVPGFQLNRTIIKCTVYVVPLAVGEVRRL